MALDERLKKHISKIGRNENPHSKSNLKSASEAISKLKDFIEEKITLSPDEIVANLHTLLRNDIDMNSKHEKGINIIRARKTDEVIVGKPCFDNITELSYPPKSSVLSRGGVI